jgi:hypothetical protein
MPAFCLLIYDVSKESSLHFQEQGIPSRKSISWNLKVKVLSTFYMLGINKPDALSNNPEDLQMKYEAYQK